MASLVKLGGVGVSNQRGDAGVQRGEAYRANILKRCTIDGERWDAAL